MNLKDSHQIIDYDNSQFPFKQLFQDHCKRAFSAENFKFLQSDFSLPASTITVKNDQDGEIYKQMHQIDHGYDQASSENRSEGKILKLIANFSTLLARHCFHEKLDQDCPTIRVMLPENKPAGGYRRDRDYNHPETKVNIWIPVTRAHRTSSTFLETSMGSDKFERATLHPGQALIFVSALMYDNELNTEGFTRVSSVFRVIPESLYNATNVKNSIKQKLALGTNQYYEKENI